MRFLFSLFLALILSGPTQAQEFDCAGFLASHAAIATAETKEAIVDELVKQGASREDAQNFADSSPDADAMRAYLFGDGMPPEYAPCLKDTSN